VVCANADEEFMSESLKSFLAFFIVGFPRFLSMRNRQQIRKTAILE